MSGASPRRVSRTRRPAWTQALSRSAVNITLTFQPLLQLHDLGQLLTRLIFFPSSSSSIHYPRRSTSIRRHASSPRSSAESVSADEVQPSSTNASI